MEEYPQDGLARLADSNILRFIRHFLQARGLLRDDFTIVEGEEDLPYESEERFWQDVVENKQIYESRRVSLKKFALFQWIPMSPGQYHTPDGRQARLEAQQYIIERAGRSVIYDRDGKTKMIEGGIGCLRLAKRQVVGEWLHFASATTSGVAHRGILVGIPEELYHKVVRPLQLHGGLVCDVDGQIRCWWSPLERLPFDAGRYLPRLYLYAENITSVQESPLPSGFGKVTAAITFEGDVDDHPRDRFFAYGSFDPSDHHDVERCARWLEQDYVKGMYQGQVLSDFDELIPHFEGGVSLPITTLMDPRVDSVVIIQRLSQAFGISQDRVAPIVNYIVNVQGDVRGLVQGSNAQVRIVFGEG